jgi:hypothetical protein
LLPAASRAPCRPAHARPPPVWRLLAAFPAPAAACLPPTSATRPTPPVCLRPPMSWCRAAGLGHQPTLPFGPSGGPASLLGSTWRRLRPPSLPARRGGPASLLGAAVPPSLAPASLAPCFAAPCSAARLPPGLVCRGAGRWPPCPPGQWRLPARPAPLLPWLKCSM